MHRKKNENKILPLVFLYLFCVHLLEITNVYCRVTFYVADCSNCFFKRENKSRVSLFVIPKYFRLFLCRILLKYSLLSGHRCQSDTITDPGGQTCAMLLSLA